MIKLISDSSGHPDYILLKGEMDKVYTVEEAIKEIVSKKHNNMGCFYVNGWSIKFSNGTLIDRVDPNIKDFVVTEITGTDSWGQLRINIDAKGSPEPKKEQKSVDVFKIMGEMREEILPIIEKYERMFGMPIHSLIYTPKTNTSIETEVIGNGTCLKLKI